MKRRETEVTEEAEETTGAGYGWESVSALMN